MRVACIGLGDIAQKAYLPVLSSRPDIDLRLVTRDAATLARLGDRYRLAKRHTDVISAIEDGIDVAFVHSATEAHPQLVAALLAAGVHVYVDKPLARDLETCRRLADLALSAGRILMIGFNRRYAPAYAALQHRPRDLIVMQKNRACLPGLARDVAFDDFIHVADTLLSLVPGPVESTSYRIRAEHGRVQHIALQLAGDGFAAFGIMNRMSGSDEESLEVMGAGEKWRVDNLAVTTRFGTPDQVSRAPDWQPATWVRGIDQICDGFLGAVRSGAGPAPDASLPTHAICEAIAAEVEQQAGMAEGITS